VIPICTATGYSQHICSTHLRNSFFGLGTRKLVSSEASRYGKKALLIVDRNLEAIKKEVQGYLEQSSLKVEVYDGIYSEPTVGSVNDALGYAESIGPDIVIGVRGGSTLDTAKVISALLINKNRYKGDL
jgi:alcohol dehydrogenase class IV